jgi:thiol-disulfide isomerase/thioredoxin
VDVTPERPARIGATEFRGRRLDRPGTWIVAFLADWCPFCRAFEPEFAALATDGSFGLLVADMTSMQTPLWETFEIDIVPTLVVFRDGTALYRADGVAGEGLGAADLESARLAALSPTRKGGPSRPART